MVGGALDVTGAPAEAGDGGLWPFMAEVCSIGADSRCGEAYGFGRRADTAGPEDDGG
jgi:hypothetical protein